jgi:hypothetical protein
MATLIYSLCALTSLACALLLFRTLSAHRDATRLVLWSAIAFACFAVNNALVFADLVVRPNVNLAVMRAATACIAGGVLLFGLIWQTD